MFIFLKKPNRNMIDLFHYYSGTRDCALASLAAECGCQSESSTRLSFSSTKSCTDSRRNTLVHSTMSPTCLAADLSVLLAPTVCQCRRLSWQPSPTNRAFPVVDPRTWNDLPDDVTSAESLSTFRQWLKTHLFTKSFFSDYSLDWTSHNLSLVDLAVVCIT